MPLSKSSLKSKKSEWEKIISALENIPRKIQRIIIKHTCFPKQKSLAIKAKEVRMESSSSQLKVK